MESSGVPLGNVNVWYLLAASEGRQLSLCEKQLQGPVRLVVLLSLTPFIVLAIFNIIGQLSRGNYTLKVRKKT